MESIIKVVQNRKNKSSGGNSSNSLRFDSTNIHGIYTPDSLDVSNSIWNNTMTGNNAYGSITMMGGSTIDDNSVKLSKNQMGIIKDIKDFRTCYIVFKKNNYSTTDAWYSFVPYVYAKGSQVLHYCTICSENGINIFAKAYPNTLAIYPKTDEYYVASIRTFFTNSIIGSRTVHMELYLNGFLMINTKDDGNLYDVNTSSKYTRYGFSLNAYPNDSETGISTPSPYPTWFKYLALGEDQDYKTFINNTTYLMNKFGISNEL